jgi:hypothetical protein
MEVRKEVKKKDYTIHLYSFLILIICVLVYFNIHQQDKIKEIEAPYQKKISKLENENSKLKELIDIKEKKYGYFEKLIKDLDRCNYPEDSLGIGYSESNLKYNIKHPTKDLDGIGGLKKYWNKTLNAHKIKKNSLQAIDHVYSLYLIDCKENRVNALKGYKGTIKNFYSFHKTRALIKKIKKTGYVKKILLLHNREKILKNQ